MALTITKDDVMRFVQRRTVKTAQKPKRKYVKVKPLASRQDGVPQFPLAVVNHSAWAEGKDSDWELRDATGMMIHLAFGEEGRRFLVWAAHELNQAMGWAMIDGKMMLRAQLTALGKDNSKAGRG